MRARRPSARNGLMKIAAVCCLGPTAALYATPPAQASAFGAAHVAPGTRLWVSRFHSSDALAIAVSNGGSKVFVTGSATIAYDAATGNRLWVDQPTGGDAIAVSPDRNVVFITGAKTTPLHLSAYFHTVAYQATTGAQLWASDYALPGPRRADPQSLAVSPDGSAVFVTGYSRGQASGFDYTTVAYNAVTGTQLWVRRYNGPANGNDFATAVDISKDGRTVYVTGISVGGRPRRFEFATIAYSAATGARRWVSRFNERASRSDSAPALRVSSGTVFIAGTSGAKTSPSASYATVAYSAATGAQRWVRMYAGARRGGNFESSLAVGRGGRAVYVTGESQRSSGLYDFATVAYRAGTGARMWVSRYRPPRGCNADAGAVAVGPGGRSVFVAGDTAGTSACRIGFATAAYSAATGAQRWVRHYYAGKNFESGMAVSRVTDTVVVTGDSIPHPPNFEFVTVAYHG